MNLLAPEKLHQFCPRSALYFKGLLRCQEKYQIDTPNRIAAFLGQVHCASGGFLHVKEMWGPSELQERYENNAQLGNNKPGDGLKFRGRGLLPIRGRMYYNVCSLSMFSDKRLLATPEILELPEFAVLSAGWVWHSRGLNKFADEWDVDRITTLLGGLRKEERKRLSEEARAILNR